MAKKEPDLPDEKDARLQAAIKGAEAEVERVKAWLANEQKETGRRQPRRTTSTEESSRHPEQQAPRVGSNQTDQLLSNILIEDRKSGVMSRRHLVIAIVTVIVATLGLIFNSNRNTETVVQQIQQNELDITDPPQGASVGLGQRVRGNTPYPYLNHYLVVKLVRTGSTSIQPAIVDPDGTFSGEVRFSDGGGNIAVGEDDEFTVRVLATKQKLEAGSLATFPDDAKLSRPITVRRTKPSEQIIITAPANAAEVGFDGTITGKTSFPELTHYIVIKSLRSGTRYVQDRPASISRTDGTFTGSGKFGGVELGIGEQYMVQIFATTSSLPAGPLTKDPTDAVLSNSVTVTRKR